MIQLDLGFSKRLTNSESSVLKSSFERVDRKSIDDLSFVNTVTGHTNLFPDSFWFFS